MDRGPDSIFARETGAFGSWLRHENTLLISNAPYTVVSGHINISTDDAQMLRLMHHADEHGALENEHLARVQARREEVPHRALTLRDMQHSLLERIDSIEQGFLFCYCVHTPISHSSSIASTRCGVKAV